ncbi:Protein CBR-RSP-6 [Caenorhabditis briggsae]|uniref:Protein CBR-RSP-6 n=1 Tax=Caenorhabditis briggsae TaxID=6238 RepID=A8XRJ6_CAEBR|nr:Protein CBR-RSP-6 [Caenorhabditis briggsae]CAP35270.2 Protein CBR-RSP-6 [Caenorhabditis briggsae]
MDAKVYVGGLPSDATSQELEEIFDRFGRIRKVWVARRPPGFAFVEYDDVRDAEDAVRALDGSRICGVRARVELSTGQRRGGGGRGGGYGGGYGGRGGGRDSSIRGPYFKILADSARPRPHLPSQTSLSSTPLHLLSSRHLLLLFHTTLRPFLLPKQSPENCICRVSSAKLPPQ